MYAVLATETIGLYEIYNEFGVVVSRYDRATATYYELDGTPKEPLQEESDAIAAAQGYMEATDNERLLAQGIRDNIVALKGVIAAVNAILDLTNAEINNSPAPVIKDLARELKTCARQTIRVAKVVGHDLGDLDLGTA